MADAIGRTRRVRIHNATAALLRFEIEHWPWPRGRLSYPEAIWRRDHVLMELCDLLQHWLTIHAGPVDGIPAPMLPQFKSIVRDALAELSHEARQRKSHRYPGARNQSGGGARRGTARTRR